MSLIRCFLNAGDRARDRCPDGSELYLVIPICEDIPARADAFCGGIDPQRIKIDVHGIAQVHAFLDLLELHIAQLEVDHRNTDVMAVNVRLSGLPQLGLCRFLLKLVAQVDRADLSKRECAGRVDRLFRQRNNRFRVRIMPERIYSGVDVRVVLFLLNACQVLSVADCDTAVLASVRVKPAGIAVIRPFPVPVIQQ